MNTLDQRLDSAAADLWMAVDRAHDTVGPDQLAGSELEPKLAPVVMIRRWDSPPRPHRARIVFAVAAAAAIVGVLVVAEGPGKEPVGPVTPVVPSISPTTTTDVATARDKALAALAAEKKLLEERAAQEAAKAGSEAGAPATAPEATSPSCPTNPPFRATVLPDGFSAVLLPGSGGQVTIGPDGGAVPIEPVDPTVHHYAAELGRYINIVNSALPGYVSTMVEPIDVLGTIGQFGEVEDGFKVEFSQPCGTYTLMGYGVSSSDFKKVITSLELD